MTTPVIGTPVAQKAQVVGNIAPAVQPAVQPAVAVSPVVAATDVAPVVEPVLIAPVEEAAPVALAVATEGEAVVEPVAEEAVEEVVANPVKELCDAIALIGNKEAIIDESANISLMAEAIDMAGDLYAKLEEGKFPSKKSLNETTVAFRDLMYAIKIATGAHRGRALLKKKELLPTIEGNRKAQSIEQMAATALSTITRYFNAMEASGHPLTEEQKAPYLAGLPTVEAAPVVEPVAEVAAPVAAVLPV